MRIRLYTQYSLAVGESVILSQEQAHYLRDVLRVRTGDEVFLFNGRDGEFSGTVAELSKKNAVMECRVQTRPQKQSREVVLYFAPLKRDCTDWVVEKATELGATRIVPVMTEFTTASRVNTDRLRAIAIEAAEQSRRLDVPEIDEPVALKELLRSRGAQSPVLFHLDETGKGKKAPIVDGAVSFLVGPEGGFSDAERDWIARAQNTVGLDLGERILRAETAALAALSLFTCC